MYIGIDFDGTVVKHQYPKIGEDIGAVPVLKELVAKGHKLILITMRSDEYLDAACEWFYDNGVELYDANQNPSQRRWTHSPKIYANVYIDDAGIGTPIKIDEDGRAYVDWEKTRELLVKQNIL